LSGIAHPHISAPTCPVPLLSAGSRAKAVSTETSACIMHAGRGARPRRHPLIECPARGDQGNYTERAARIGTVEMAEATGIGSASSIRPEGRSRIPFPDLRTEPASDPRWPSRRDPTSPLRYRVRARRLTPEQESTIRALAGTRSLRSLAAQLGVSQETIRAVMRKDRGTTADDRPT
jgi:hypothetical protein